MVKKHGKKIKKIIVLIVVAFIGLGIFAKRRKRQSIYEDNGQQKNPLEGKRVIFVEDERDAENADGVRGHLEAVGDSTYVPGFYDRYVKRAIDVFLSGMGLIILSPVYLVISLAIIIDDPGPVLFTQKRTGQNKRYFKLHKFRSMKMSTPHDVPTHMLENPEQYITRVGKFLRAHSLDELPQVWDIFIGNMSIIGPRPGLWNQDVLTAERDKYGANDIRPGLTGWAQINGRDELEIPVKARLDGEYVQKESFWFDVRCFFGTIRKVGHDDSVVEGGTRELKKQQNHGTLGRSYTEGKSDEALIGQIGFSDAVQIDGTAKKKVLITGKGSYIGEAFRTYGKQHYPDNFDIDELDMMDADWDKEDFSRYDIVYHVAGIAHADVGHVDDAVKEQYYKVNTDLAVDVCKKAKAEGVKTFIFMSSMIVYGESAPYGKERVIDEHTVPKAANFYGDSKLQADVAVRALADDTFKVIVLRPPMIYGKGSKGNYPTLAKIAKKIPVFPNVNNERSMLYIENLCEFLCQIMLIREQKDNAIVLIPQNGEWTKTSEMVKAIAEASGKHMVLIGGIMNLAVWIGSKVPGKIGGLVNKAFGSSCYIHDISVYSGLNYQIVPLEKSIEKTEVKELNNNEKIFKQKAMILASVASMIEQFNMNNIDLLLEHGYDVDVVCNCKEGNTISDERIDEMIKLLSRKGVNVYDIPIPRKISDVKAILNSYHLVKKLCIENHYNLLHCHSPIGSVIARIAAKGRVDKVIYTAHGFHFYKGAPLLNWLVFLPIEYLLSFFTDILITINKEDYEFAKKHMHAKKIEYIPGVGIDTKKFVLENFDKVCKRKELGIDENDIMILSVGELNDNKNHEVVVRAIGQLNDHRIHYFIAGKGDKGDFLESLAKELSVNLHLLGYRTDIVDLLNSADIYAFPSKREGLSVALMEAMAAGLPCVVSKIRGNVDLVEDQKGGYLCHPSDVEGFSNYISTIVDREELKKSMGYVNKSFIKKYDTTIVMKEMEDIYFE